MLTKNRGENQIDKNSTELTTQGFAGGTSGKEPDFQHRRHEMQVQFLGGEDPLEEEMATHSSILAWRIPRTEESGGQQSIGSHRVRHD